MNLNISCKKKYKLKLCIYFDLFLRERHLRGKQEHIMGLSLLNSNRENEKIK